MEQRGRFGSIRMVQMQLILELLRHGRLVDRIEENQKNGHSGGEIGFQVPSYYDTVLYNNSRLL